MLRQANSSFSKAQLTQSVEAAIENSDTTRVDNLKRIRRLKSSKLTAQKNAYHRLLLKQDKSHPRAKKLEQQLRDNNLELISLQMEINRASTPVPKLEANGWLIHGYVYNAVGEPLANADIQIFLADGRERSEFGTTRSDAKGYYKLSYQTQLAATAELAGVAGLAMAADNVEDENNAAESSTGDTQEGVQLNSGLRINSNVSAVSLQVNRASSIIFVRAIDPADQSIHGDSSFIEPHVGIPNYRDIIVPTKNTFDYSEIEIIKKSASQQKISEGTPKRVKKL